MGPQIEFIWHTVAQLSPAARARRLFAVDGNDWILFGLAFLCIVAIGLCMYFQYREMTQRRENERRMIELLESIDRRLAEQERKGDH